MARIRTVKPEFFRHEGLYQAEVETSLPLRVAFAGLWTASDREGRFEWCPKRLKLDCLPYDEIDFSRVLDALTTRGFVVKFEFNGREFGYIPSWRKHQVINNRETDSAIPDPSKIKNMTTRAPRVDDACPTRLMHAQGEGKGREGEGNVLITAVDGVRNSPASDEQKSGVEEKTHPQEFLSRFEAELKRAKLENPTIANPIACRWLANGATPSLVANALAEACKARNQPNPLTAAFVDPIVERHLAADCAIREAAKRKEDATNAKLAESRAAMLTRAERPENIQIPRKFA